MGALPSMAAIFIFTVEVHESSQSHVRKCNDLHVFHEKGGSRDIHSPLREDVSDGSGAGSRPVSMILMGLSFSWS